MTFYVVAGILTTILVVSVLWVYIAEKIEDRHRHRQWSDAGSYALYTGFLIAILGAGILGTMAIIAMFMPKHVSAVYQTNLQAISTSSGTTGSFFLGTGSIDSTLYYVYYAKSADGSFRMDKIEADSVSIVESGSQEPALIRTCYSPPEWWMKGCHKNTYRIIVPPGSIKPMINMDLPKE